MELPSHLPDTLRYEGEYGSEIISFVPFVYTCFTQGLLGSKKVSTYAGMAPYYCFLPADQLILREEPRHYARLPSRWWPNADEHQHQDLGWSYPDYRSLYANSEFKWDKPTLFVQNKFQVEWDQGPINYLSLLSLHHIFAALCPYYKIVYSRPGIREAQEGYASDHSTFCSYPDRAMINQYPEVSVLEDMAESQNYNEVKLKVLANCHHSVSVQGGGNYILALYPAMALTFFHRQGQEYPRTYFKGFYTYAASPAPQVHVARTGYELARCVDLLKCEAIHNPYRGFLGNCYRVYQSLRAATWLRGDMQPSTRGHYALSRMIKYPFNRALGTRNCTGSRPPKETT